MRILFFLLLCFFSFNSFAAYKVSVIGNDCGSASFLDGIKGLTFATEDDLFNHLKTVATGSTCKGYAFSHVYDYRSSNRMFIRYPANGRYSTNVYYGGTTGCDFNECKAIATQKCAANSTTLKQESYFFRGSNDYDFACNDAPPEEPIKTEEECFNHANNSCNVHGSVSDMLFTDNNDFTYECTFTCGDGSTGDENGSHAGNSDGICNQDDPNDLIDCDAPIEDPDCVGCGAFTPDDTTELPYNPDGTTGTDGTGTDAMTSLQGDVLINEVKKLKNENAKQTIKSTNAISDAIADIDNDDKLQGIIDAVNNSSGSGGNTYNDSGLRSDVDALRQTVASASSLALASEASSLDAKIANDNLNSDKIVDAITGLGTGSVPRHVEPSPNLKGVYVSAYPLGVAGVFAGRLEEFKATEFYIFLEQFKPTFGGTPPNMSFCMNFGAHMNLGCFDLVLDPRIWPALKIFILITAGFTCRKILFGG
jgi:hypothetical protein